MCQMAGMTYVWKAKVKLQDINSLHNAQELLQVEEIHKCMLLK